MRLGEFIEGYTATGPRLQRQMIRSRCTSITRLRISRYRFRGHQGQAGGDARYSTCGSAEHAADDTIQANRVAAVHGRRPTTIRKGNIGNVTLTNNGPGLISGAYVHGDDLLCNSFEGTFDDPAHDGSGYVIVDVVSASGHWLESNQPFCTFAVNLSCSTRVTNGYNAAVYSYGPVQYLLGIQAT
jgi:hypothetical protein